MIGFLLFTYEIPNYKTSRGANLGNDRFIAEEDEGRKQGRKDGKEGIWSMFLLEYM